MERDSSTVGFVRNSFIGLELEAIASDPLPWSFSSSLF